jgi:cell division protein FtsB
MYKTLFFLLSILWYQNTFGQTSQTGLKPNFQKPKYLFEDSTLGLAAIEGLLVKIEDLVKSKKKADSEISVWQAKHTSIENAKDILEQKIKTLEDKEITTENELKERITKIDYLQNALEESLNAYQKITLRVSQLEMENAKLRAENNEVKAENKVLKEGLKRFSQKSFEQGISLGYMRKGKKGKIEYLHKSAAKVKDVDEIAIFYNFTVPKIIYPNNDTLTLKIRSLKFEDDSHKIYGKSENDYWIFSGKIILRKDKDLVFKSGSWKIDIFIFDAENALSTSKTITLKK